jgi:hypothetical protein
MSHRRRCLHYQRHRSRGIQRQAARLSVCPLCIPFLRRQSNLDAQRPARKTLARHSDGPPPTFPSFCSPNLVACLSHFLSRFQSTCVRTVHVQEYMDPEVVPCLPLFFTASNRLPTCVGHPTSDRHAVQSCTDDRKLDPSGSGPYPFLASKTPFAWCAIS